MVFCLCRIKCCALASIEEYLSNKIKILLQSLTVENKNC